MFQKFSENTKKIIKNAKLEMQKFASPFVGTEHIILSILNSNLDIKNKLNDYNINYDIFRNKLIEKVGIGSSTNSYFIYTPLLKRIIENSILFAKEENILEVTPEMLFLSILSEGEGVGIRILKDLNIDVDKLYLELEKNKTNQKNKINKKSLLLEYGIDLLNLVKNGNINRVVGREKEIEEVIEILSRKNKNNPLLIGEAGVGKTAIVEYLAYKIYHNDVPNFLKNKRIISLSMSNLVSGTKYRGEFEERIEKVIKEIENNDDIIIFIDEIHLIVGAGGAEGAIDASNILKPYLARDKIKLIGATTLKEYKDSIEKDKALNRRFQSIFVKESTLDETKEILKYLKPIYEKYHDVKVSDNIIDKIVELTDSYILNKNNPDKSIDILDEVCAKKSITKDNKEIKLEELKYKLNNLNNLKNEKIIEKNYIEATNLKQLEILYEEKINKLKFNKSKREVKLNDIYSLINNKTNIPIYENNKLNKLNCIEKKLQRIVVGQNNAINKIMIDIKKKYLRLIDIKKVLSFLIIGKSGVGKSLFARELAKLFNMNLIKIDGLEYSDNYSINKIINSNYNHYSILDDVINNPYSILLIENIDECSQSFINLLLRIINDGYITNSNHEKIYFYHTIVIMTSNKINLDISLGFNHNKSNSLKDYFNEDFLDKIDSIVEFNDLGKNDIKTIINNEIKSVKKKYKISKNDLTIHKSLINDIICLSNYNNNGARKIKEIVNKKINDILFKKIFDMNNTYQKN